MNPTSNTSIWEDPSGAGGSIYVAYNGDDVVEFVIESTDSAQVSEVAAELERRFGIRTLVDSDGAG